MTSSGYQGDTAIADITLRTSSPLALCLKNHSVELQAIKPGPHPGLHHRGLGTSVELYAKTDAALLLEGVLGGGGVWDLKVHTKNCPSGFSWVSISFSPRRTLSSLGGGGSKGATPLPPMVYGHSATLLPGPSTTPGRGLLTLSAAPACPCGVGHVASGRGGGGLAWSGGRVGTQGPKGLGWTPVARRPSGTAIQR